MITLVTKQLKSRFFFILLLVDNLTERPGSEQIITDPDPLMVLLRIRNTDFLFIYFRRAKVYWPMATPLLKVCRSSMIFRIVWFRTLSAAGASRRATNLANHPSKLP
jgi:hypothetical protein